MVAVALDRAWLTDLASGQALSFFSRDWQETSEVQGEVRRYAGGRLRSVARAGRARSLTATAVRVPRETREALEDRQGAVQLLRDVQGRKLYGVFFSLAVADYKDRGGFDVTFRLDEVTHDEALVPRIVTV